jgi:hypothetical protein
VVSFLEKINSSLTGSDRELRNRLVSTIFLPAWDTKYSDCAVVTGTEKVWIVDLGLMSKFKKPSGV